MRAHVDQELRLMLKDLVTFVVKLALEEYTNLFGVQALLELKYYETITAKHGKRVFALDFRVTAISLVQAISFACEGPDKLSLSHPQILVTQHLLELIRKHLIEWYELGLVQQVPIGTVDLGIELEKTEMLVFKFLV